MNSDFFKITNFWVLVGAIASFITILSITVIKKTKIRNDLTKTKVKGSYSGGRIKDSEAKIENKLKDVEIGGDYSGGDSK